MFISLITYILMKINYFISDTIAIGLFKNWFLSNWNSEVRKILFWVWYMVNCQLEIIKVIICSAQFIDASI